MLIVLAAAAEAAKALQATKACERVRIGFTVCLLVLTGDLPERGSNQRNGTAPILQGA
jgi:hypothetical protein